MNDDDTWTKDYHHLNSIQKNWMPWWLTGSPSARFKVWVGGDEFLRLTLVVGPVVFPLWRCRCPDCAAELTKLRRRVEAD